MRIHTHTHNTAMEYPELLLETGDGPFLMGYNILKECTMTVDVQRRLHERFTPEVCARARRAY